MAIRRPARWGAYRWRIVETPPLAEFVLLSMLLHVLGILLFGAPSGGSREGRAMWGSLEVSLPGAFREPAPLLKLDSSLGAGTRAAPEPPRPAPAAAPRPAPPARELSITKEIAPPPAPRVEPVPEEAPRPMPRLLDRLPKSEPDIELPPALKLPPPADIPFVPMPLPERRVVPEISVPELAPVEAPAPEPPPAPRIEASPEVAPAAPAPRVERPPEEAPAIPAPVLLPPPAVPTPPVEPPKVEVPAIPVPAPRPAERVPIETPAVPVPAITPPVERPPVEVPALPVPKVESAAPQAIPQEMPASQPPAAAPAEPRLPPREAAPRIEREAPARTEREAPIRTDALPRIPSTRTPSATSEPARKGDDVPSSYDPTAPRIDLDAARRRAGQIAREGAGQRAIFAIPVPPKPEHKTKEAIAIENARKPDCRTAYQALGLAAVVPLIANEFGEGTCRW